jgi:hypothetical protein
MGLSAGSVRGTVGLAVLAALAVAPGHASAQDGGAANGAAAPLTGSDVEWAHRPTGEDYARAYPPRAAQRTISGGAVLVCRISDHRTLEACEAKGQSPDGIGFGEAAIKVAGKFRLKAEQRDPRAVAGAEVVMGLIFRVWR